MGESLKKIREPLQGQNVPGRGNSEFEVHKAGARLDVGEKARRAVWLG